MLGLYVSDHPLLGLEHVLSNGTDCTIGQLMLDEERPDGATITISGLVTSVQRKITKRGDAWAMVTLEDLDGAIDVLLFPSAYQLASTYLSEDAILTVKGRLSRSKDQPELHGQEVTVPDISDGPSGPVVISLPSTRCTGPGGRAAQGRPGHPPGHDRGAAAAADPRGHQGDAARRPAAGDAEPGALRRPQAAPGTGMPERVIEERPVVERSSLLPALRQVLLVLGLFAVGGALAGVLWEWIWSPPVGVVLEGKFLLDGDGLRADFSGTGLYVTIATITGVLLGALVAAVTERREVLVLVAVAAGSVLAGWLMLRVGLALDPPDPRPLAVGLEDFTELPDELHVEGRSPLLCFPAGALVGLIVVFVGLARHEETGS